MAKESQTKKTEGKQARKLTYLEYVGEAGLSDSQAAVLGTGEKGLKTSEDWNEALKKLMGSKVRG